MNDLFLDINSVKYSIIYQKNENESIDDKLRKFGVDNSMELSTIEKLTQVGRENALLTLDEIPISNDCEK